LIPGNDDIKRLTENGDIKRLTENLFNLIENTVVAFNTKMQLWKSLQLHDSLCGYAAHLPPHKCVVVSAFVNGIHCPFDY
jgi:hypothetical protein